MGRVTDCPGVTIIVPVSAYLTCSALAIHSLILVQRTAKEMWALHSRDRRAPLVERHGFVSSGQSRWIVISPRAPPRCPLYIQL